MSTQNEQIAPANVSEMLTKASPEDVNTFFWTLFQYFIKPLDKRIDALERRLIANEKKPGMVSTEYFKGGLSSIHSIRSYLNELKEGLRSYEVFTK